VLFFCFCCRGAKRVLPLHAVVRPRSKGAQGEKHRAYLCRQEKAEREKTVSFARTVYRRREKKSMRFRSLFHFVSDIFS